MLQIPAAKSLLLVSHFIVRRALDWAGSDIRCHSECVLHVTDTKTKVARALTQTNLHLERMHTAPARIIPGQHPQEDGVARKPDEPRLTTTDRL